MTRGRRRWQKEAVVTEVAMAEARAVEMEEEAMVMGGGGVGTREGGA